jgi:hypothetical protein
MDAVISMTTSRHRQTAKNYVTPLVIFCKNSFRLADEVELLTFLIGVLVRIGTCALLQILSQRPLAPGTSPDDSISVAAPFSCCLNENAMHMPSIEKVLPSL